jgi:phosphoribosylglycinamide formyltransferase-1
MARRTAVLISGGGSNLQALLDSTRQPGASAEIVLVVSNRADAYGLERARRAGVAIEVVPHRDYPDRERFDAAIDRLLRANSIELVCLAGFMRLLGPAFVDGWRDRLLNIHPSLLPAYRGLHPHERAIADGVRVAGCTVHMVRAEMDAGPIIVQGVAPVLADDTPGALASRVLELEHRCYPRALELVASGRTQVVGERVVVEPGSDAVIVHPALPSGAVPP